DHQHPQELVPHLGHRRHRADADEPAGRLRHLSAARGLHDRGGDLPGDEPAARTRRRVRGNPSLQGREGAAMSFDIDLLLRYAPLLLQGLWTTVYICAAAAVLA